MSKKRKAPRPAAVVSNDFSEGMPVTTGELRRLVRWERANFQHLLNLHTRLRGACVRVGLILTSDQPPFAAVQVLMEALRHKK
jgi:hypothetical protein